MALQYRLYQMTNSRSGSNGKWFGRAVVMNEVHTDDLASIVERNCSMKRSDVKAVIEELIEVIRDQMANSNRVVLDGLGAFKATISCSGAQTAKDFTPSVNVRKTKVIFQPTVKIGADGRRVKALLEGIKVAELPENSVDKTATSTVTGA